MSYYPGNPGFGAQYGAPYGAPYGTPYGAPYGVQGGFVQGCQPVYGAPSVTNVYEQPVMIQQTQQTPPVSTVVGSAPVYQKPGVIPHRHHYPQNTYGPRYY